MNVIFTDFFFSFGGAVVPILATYLILQSCEWYTIYLILQVIAVAILVMVVLTDFTIVDKDKDSPKHNALSLSSWGVSLYCIAFAAFLFLLAQMVMTSYAQSYFQDVMNWGAIDANKPLAYFWAAQCVGLFLSPLVTRYIPLRCILPLFMIVAIGTLAIIVYVPILDPVLKASIIFGLFNCYIYAGLLAYGTFQMENPPPTLITTILLFGTTGTALSTTLGAFINKYFGLTTVMNTAVAFYIISFILIILAVFYSKECEDEV